jgi:hypothetical protein
MSSKLLALKIRRRHVAAAVFSGRHPEFLDTLQLCNEPEAVTDTLARFLAWILENYHPQTAAIGTSEDRQGERVMQLNETAEEMFLSEGIPVWKVEDKDLLYAYAFPKLKNKLQLRPIVAAFWPALEEKKLTAYEAAALGHYVQVERLLSHH